MLKLSAPRRDPKGSRNAHGAHPRLPPLVFTPSQALKAMVLMRSGLREEAVALSQEVLRTRPTDLGVLHAVGASRRRVCGPASAPQYKSGVG